MTIRNSVRNVLNYRVHGWKGVFMNMNFMAHINEMCIDGYVLDV